MRRISCLLVWALLPCLSHATGQQPDLLLYRGDTLALFANPLEPAFDSLTPRPASFFPEDCRPTSCWRGYQATWQLEYGQLYLLRIGSCCRDEPSPANLRRWFLPDQQGRVPARWVNGWLRVPRGRLLHYEHMGYESIYEQDLELLFSGGRLLLQRTFDNRATRPGLCERDVAACQQTILRAVRWPRLPQNLDRHGGKVFVEVKADSLGRPARCTVLKGLGAPFDAEAVRAVQSIPDWGARYRAGRWQPVAWIMPVQFSEENRRKYAPAASRPK